MPQQRNGVGAQCQAHGDVILHDFLAFAHLWQAHCGLTNALTIQIARKQRQGVDRGKKPAPPTGPDAATG